MENENQGKIYSFVRWRGFKEPYRQDNLSLKEAKALFKQEVDAIKYMVLQNGMVSIAGLMSFTGIMKGKIFIRKYDGRKALKQVQGNSR
ncbi:MAG: hypothetical protein QXY62_06375 [Candidatus Altiarchaeota archaeon]